MARKFNVGDVVYLKSGSDPMTVKGYDSYLVGLKEQLSDVDLTCVWLAQDTKEMHSRSFHQDMLTKEQPDF